MKIHEKWTPKGHPNSSKIGAAGAQGLEFYDLGSFLGAPFFGCFFGAAKSKPVCNRNVGAKIDGIIINDLDTSKDSYYNYNYNYKHNYHYLSLSLSLCTSVHIYRERERGRDRKRQHGCRMLPKWSQER